MLRRLSRHAEGLLGQAYRDLVRVDVLDLAPRLTLILLVLYAGEFWYLKVPLRVLCIGALLYRPIFRSYVFWFLISCFMVASAYQNWYSIDNHKYLMTYWTLVLFCTFLASGARRQRRVMARNAKLLIGLCMLFATVWKLISVDYLDGSFFRHTLLLDSRFGSVARLAGGLSAEAVFQNRSLEAALRQGTRDFRVVESVELADTPRIRTMAAFLTFWTIGIEALLALLFLLPERALSSRWRHYGLLLFAVTTYSVATVIGFAWLLLIMGVAQCDRRQAGLRLTYLAVFLLMMIYTGSWSSLLVLALARFQVA